MLLKVPGGRIYAFYNHNTDGVSEVKREDKGVYKRVDSLGHYVFKYSDDHGKSWSEKRYEVPVREFECDRKNVYGGKLRFFWNVGRPLIVPDAAVLTLHKVGAMGDGFYPSRRGRSSGARTSSPNETRRRSRLRRCPMEMSACGRPRGGGRVAEEQSVVRLSDGSLYCVYRTIDGWPASRLQPRWRPLRWTAPAYRAIHAGRPASETSAGRELRVELLRTGSSCTGSTITAASSSASSGPRAKGDEAPTTTATRPG